MLNYDQTLIEQIHSKGSRQIVGFILEKLSKINQKIVAAYADVGSRFGVSQVMGVRGIQVSIAEQSLIGIISGFYNEGFIPYGVAYAPFITMRAADQIRMSIGEMNLGIKIIGGSAGLVSGNLGSASMALDDLAMMRAIPNLVILSPADCLETAKMIEVSSEIDNPVYIRLTGGNDIHPVYKSDFEYTIGKANVVLENGSDIVIYATGVQVHTALEVSNHMSKNGIHCTVVDMHTIKPLDEEVIERYQNIPLAISLEEHNYIGGLGSALSEYISEKSKQRLIRIGIHDCYPAPDSYDRLLCSCGLTSNKVVDKIMEELNNEI